MNEHICPLPLLFVRFGGRPTRCSPPAILRASNQHLKCIHMESISTQMYYFPFSVIILHLPKILPILSKKQEGLAKLAALNLCLKTYSKPRPNKLNYDDRFQVNCLLSQQPECRLCRSQNAKRKATHFTFTSITFT